MCQLLAMSAIPAFQGWQSQVSEDCQWSWAFQIRKLFFSRTTCARFTYVLHGFQRFSDVSEGPWPCSQPPWRLQCQQQNSVIRIRSSSSGMKWTRKSWLLLQAVLRWAVESLTMIKKHQKAVAFDRTFFQPAFPCLCGSMWISASWWRCETFRDVRRSTTQTHNWDRQNHKLLQRAFVSGALAAKRVAMLSLCESWRHDKTCQDMCETFWVGMSWWKSRKRARWGGRAA